MKALSTELALLAIAIVGSTLPAPLVSAQGKAGASKWEYRILTKGEVLELGNKDLTAGLNKLGDEGWELAAVDSAYLFKRPKGPSRQQVEAALKERVALAEAEVEQLKERVAWVTRMARKGFVAEQQLEADKAALQVAEVILDRARRELAMAAEAKAPEKLPHPKEK
jgi:hypothetical protein